MPEQKVRILILLLLFTACKPSGPDPETTQELRFQARSVFTTLKGVWAETNKWPSMEESGHRLDPGFTVKLITRQGVQDTDYEGGFIATVTHTASGQCIRIDDNAKFSGCDEPLPKMFTQPPPSPPKPTPPPPAEPNKLAAIPVRKGCDPSRPPRKAIGCDHPFLKFFDGSEKQDVSVAATDHSSRESVGFRLGDTSFSYTRDQTGAV